jgi:hypothetical protein
MSSTPPLNQRNCARYLQVEAITDWNFEFPDCTQEWAGALVSEGLPVWERPSRCQDFVRAGLGVARKASKHRIRMSGMVSCFDQTLLFSLSKTKP